jgi:hypothetical protein
MDIILVVIGILSLYNLYTTRIETKRYKNELQKIEDDKITKAEREATELAVLKERLLQMRKDIDKILTDMTDLDKRVVSSEYLQRISEHLKTVVSMQIEIEKLKMLITIKEKQANGN